MVNKLYFHFVAIVGGFIYYFDMGLPVYIGGGTSTPIVLAFYIFICVLLKTKSSKVVLIVVGDIFLIEVYCKGY